jgi:hypothetical protein
MPKHTKVWLILGMLFSILSTHLPVLYTLFYHEITSAPTTMNGTIDLSSLSANKKIVLDGKWEFYWNRLIVSNSEQGGKADLLMRVPDYWSKYKIGEKFLPADGIASYRLEMKGIHALEPVTVYIPDFGSAYRVYLNGELAAESGIVSEKETEIFTTPKTELYPVTLSDKEDCEVVIEVATTRFSGLYMAPILQSYDSAVGGAEIQSGVRFILFGIVLFSLFVLSIVYGLSLQKGMRFGWLPVLILCVLLRLLLTTELFGFLQSTIFSKLSYETSNDLMFLATFVLKFLLIFLFQEQFGIMFSRKEKIGFLLYYTAIYLAHLFIPYGIYNRHLTIVLPTATFLLEFYAFFKVYFSHQPLKKHGFPIFWGTVIAISGLSIDCYYINGNSYLNLSLVLISSLAVNLVILSLVYVTRIVELYNDVAISSASLSLARNQIAMQMQYYDDLSSRINEVRAVRHDIHHFVEVIKRLSNEGHYEELNQFINDYGEKAETESLPVFCENIVANSILGYYSLKAKENNITFSCASAIPRQLTVNDSDLCTVLSNGLENAIEACKKLENPEEQFIHIEVRNTNGQMLIKIKNSFNGSIKTQDGSYLTNKNGDFHGMGIKNIQKVMQISGGYLKIQHEEKVFTLMAAFPNS